MTVICVVCGKTPAMTQVGDGPALHPEHTVCYGCLSPEHYRAALRRHDGGEPATPRRAPLVVGRSDDVRAVGWHPGLGVVADAADLAKKIERAKRAGKSVEYAKNLPSVPDTGGPTKTNPGPSAWDKTADFMRGV